MYDTTTIHPDRPISEQHEPHPGSEPTRTAPRTLRRRLRWPALTTLVVQVVLVAGDRMPSVDAMSYFETGRNLLEGNGYTRAGGPELHFPPVAPVSLALLERMTGSDMHALRVWTLIWGLAIVALLTTIGWWISRDDDVTVATAWLATFVPGVVTLAVSRGSGSDLATVNLVLGSALLVLIAIERRSRHTPGQHLRWLGAAGALAGLAYLTRPESLLPSVSIGIAALVFTFADAPGRTSERLARTAQAGAAFGLVALLFIAPFVVHTHRASGSWSLTSKTQDGSLEAWRAIAEGQRLERDQTLYAIQPDGVSLGPETRSLTAIAAEDPGGWLSIVRVNAQTIFERYIDATWHRGPVWALIPAVLLIPALAQIWATRRSRATRLLVVVAAWPLLTCLLFFALPRYLMLTTAVLIPFGAWGLVRATRPRSLTGRRVAWVAIAGLSLTSFLFAASPLLPGSNRPEATEQRTAGRWIAQNTPSNARIMTRSFHVQGYSERSVVAIPAATYEPMLEFARRMGVTYLVADESTIRRRRPELFRPLLMRKSPPEGLALVHEFTERGRTVRIYRLDPAPPPSKEPPLPLGYVSD